MPLVVAFTARRREVKLEPAIPGRHPDRWELLSLNRAREASTMGNQKWTRREVIRTGVVTAAGLMASTAARRTQAAPQAQGTLGANDRIRVAVAGVNGRGRSHIGAFVGRKNECELAYLVDPDSRLFAKWDKQLEAKGAKAPVMVQDVRRVLEDKSVDVVSIATPNHWHALMTIWACQAGKDVYVEKPMSHNVHEGRVAADAARKYNRIVQHGTQSRSDAAWANVVAVIKSGKLGKLLVARALCYKPRGSIGFKEIAQPPKELDFGLWLGPVREQPYHENLVHYNWHWFWDFGNGDIGNQGVHQMDIARWGIPGATLPKSVISLGGRFGYKDQGQTPNTQLAIMDFGDTQLIFEVRGLETKKFHGSGIGNIFHLEAGMIVDRKFYPKDSNQPAPLPKVDESRGPGGEDHFANFIAAVKSRKITDLNAEILEGHYSSALCHLACLSQQLGKPAPFNPKTKAFGDNKDAYETLGRMEEHLKGNGVKLEETEYVLGRKLTVDAKAETITGDAEAAKMIFAEYRKPFVVPETL